ncbi:hypothetical protein HAX54_035758 [Datura stramonium]|uniref:Uncharacterized protein n=1 Tax=Datura stramonium TaxID=4076 RepID=A0ABS8VGP1_DATST|nr:hypothetical protein [Datura stramonium]
MDGEGNFISTLLHGAMLLSSLDNRTLSVREALGSPQSHCIVKCTTVVSSPDGILGHSSPAKAKHELFLTCLESLVEFFPWKHMWIRLVKVWNLALVDRIWSSFWGLSGVVWYGCMGGASVSGMQLLLSVFIWCRYLVIMEPFNLVSYYKIRYGLSCNGLLGGISNFRRNSESLRNLHVKMAPFLFLHGSSGCCHFKEVIDFLIQIVMLPGLCKSHMKSIWSGALGLLLVTICDQLHVQFISRFPSDMNPFNAFLAPIFL